MYDTLESGDDRYISGYGNRFIGRRRTTGSKLIDRADVRTIMSALVLLENMATAVKASALNFDPEDRFPAYYPFEDGGSYALDGVFYDGYMANAFFSQEYKNNALIVTDPGEDINEDRYNEMFLQIFYRARATVAHLRGILGRVAEEALTMEGAGGPTLFSEVNDYNGLRYCFSLESPMAAVGRKSGLIGGIFIDDPVEVADDIIGRAISGDVPEGL